MQHGRKNRVKKRFTLFIFIVNAAIRVTKFVKVSVFCLSSLSHSFDQNKI